jgi:glycosyltransferase involved in cell wall biosynthesis
MTSRSAPYVSVIVPTHNSATFVEAALASVLAQTYTDYEIIVVDDGSTDETGEVLRRFDGRIICHWQQNQGASAARNAGIRSARGELVCLLDADDFWRPDKLSRQVAVMAANPSVGLLFADAMEADGATVQKASILKTMKFGPEALSQIPLPEAFRKLLIENFIPTSTVMIRAACFATSGLFDEDLPNAEDRDMWLRMAAHFEIGCVPVVLATKRSHGANISTRTQLALESRIKVWTQNRRRFPSLAPASVYDALLADTYQQLGYILLTNADARGARHCALAGFGCGVKFVLATGSLGKIRWGPSLALVPLSTLPWSVVRPMWRLRNLALRRTGA